MADRLDTGTPLANPKHERFAQLVVSGLPQSRAYIEAGYEVSPASAEQGASRLVKAIKVASRIEELRIPALEAVKAANAEAESAAVASAEWIIEQSLTLIRRCMAAEPVLNARGEATGEYRFDSSGANKALDRLAKMHPTVFSPDSTTIDNRSLTFNLPDGTSLADLKALRRELG